MTVAALGGTITIDVYKTLTGPNFISLVHSSNALKFPFPWSFETWALVTLIVHRLAVLLVLPHPGSAVSAVRSGIQSLLLTSLFSTSLGNFAHDQ